MESVRFVCLALFAILSTASSVKNVIQPRIINGHEAQEGQFPYMVSLRSREFNEHFCGASIVSSRFLLTAAHCCQDSHSNPKDVIALVGAFRQSSGGVEIELDTITAHGGFGRKLARFDIAILRTATEIIFNDLVQPIALPTADTPDNRSVHVVIAGWGRHKFPSKKMPDVLQFSELDTISRKECGKRFENVRLFWRRLHTANICTVDKKSGGVCNGDSGSGLIDVTDPNKETIVGIASWVYPCAKGYPDVYTRVYSHLRWIKKQIRDLSKDL